MIENYKTVLYSDEPLYKKLYERFTFYDEENNEDIHFFDRNSNEVMHIISKKHINYSINPVTGYRNISHIIIQKSFYKNKDLMMLLRKLKTFRPEVYVLIYIDNSLDFYEQFCSLVAKENLASLAFNVDEIFNWYSNTSNDHVEKQEEYIINKPNKKQLKLFNMY